MSDESEGGGGRIPEVPVPVPTPGVPQDEIVWTQWADAAARAPAVSPDDAGILRWAGFRADLGAPTYPDDDPPPGFGQPGPGLRRLAAAGLATRLADGGYWPGRHEAAVAARSAQPVLDALAGFLGAGAADILGDRWFRVEPDALAAAARHAGRSCPTQVFDELVRFLVEDGWLERRGAAHWRFTPRTLAERGPAPGPDSPFPRRRPAPGGLRGLFADADRPGTDAPREAARRAAGDRGLDADHQAVLGILASAAEPDTRLASVPRSDLASTAGVSVDRVRGILRKLAAAGLVERVHPGGMGPKDPSTYMVLCLALGRRMPPADWAESRAAGLRAPDAAVLRTLAARADPGKLLATVRLRGLGRAVGRDRTTVDAALGRLGKAGLVRVAHRGGPGRYDATRIVLRVPAAEEAG